MIESNDYDDIINLPFPNKKSIHRMSNLDRAAQFLPFDALTGYDEAVEETARLTDDEVFLDENKMDDLNKRIQLIIAHAEEKPQVIFTYFIPDSLKQGGKYQTTQGVIKKIDIYENTITLVDGIKIPISQITSIDCSLFNEYEL